MTKTEKLLLKILSGNNDKNIQFSDVCSILERFNFESRIKGSHHIYSRNDIDEIINIQSKGKFAKPYQVKQVRNIILKYKLGGSDE